MSEYADYQAFCDRICTYLMSYELGIPFQWDTPLPIEGNGRRGSGVPEDIRLTVINRHLHYYQRTSAGEEYEIQPEGSLWWLPRVPEHLNPPAMEEQLQATEDVLGFPLPPLLRALYKHIANGGFGPSQGLLGALGGGDRDGYLLTDEYLFQKAQNEPPIDLGACEHFLMESKGDYNNYLVPWEIVVPEGYWPEHLFLFIHDGCNMHFYLDGVTDHVFYSGAFPLRLRLIANSLEDFFDRWMRDDLFDNDAFQKEHPQPFGNYLPIITDFDSFDPFLDRER